MREEGFSALYRGIVPGLFLVCCWFLLFYLSILELKILIKLNIIHGLCLSKGKKSYSPLKKV